MTKFEFYLAGRKITFVADNKAIEEIKIKIILEHCESKDGWKKFSKFDFTICHLKEKKLVQSDSLSRSMVNLVINKYEDGINMGVHEILQNGKNFEPKDEIKRKIIKIHIKYGHRKKNHILKEKQIKISKNKLRNILKNRKTCLKK